MHRGTTLVLVLFLVAVARGQGKGEIKLNVSPFNGMEYVLDGKERLSNRGLVLPAGEHRFVFWSPDHQMVDTTLRVIADSTITFYKTLPVTDAYRTYKLEQKRVAQGRFFYRAVPLLVTVAAGVFVVNANKQNRETYDALVAAEMTYADLRAPSAIDGLKNDALPSLQADLDVSNKRFTTSVVVASVSVVATILGFMKAASIEDPMYEDLERVKFEGLVWVPGSKGGSVQCALTIPIR